MEDNTQMNQMDVDDTQMNQMDVDDTQMPWKDVDNTQMLTQMPCKDVENTQMHQTDFGDAQMPMQLHWALQDQKDFDKKKNSVPEEYPNTNKRQRQFSDEQCTNKVSDTNLRD